MLTRSADIDIHLPHPYTDSMGEVVNIGMWVVLIGSVYFISIGVVTGTFGAEQPEDGVLVVVAILIASTLFTEHQKKTSGDKERDKN